MPFWWPFGRRRRKNKAIKDHNLVAEKHLARDSPASPLLNEKRGPPATPPSRHVAGDVSSPASRQPVRDRAPTSPPQSQPHTANASGFPTENTSLDDITALPVTRKITESSQPRSTDRPDARSPPSLRSKRSITNDPQLSKRKSTRKRKDQSARESQIKAMSSPIPIPRRYGADAKIRAALVAGSATSLPRAASVRSSVTALSDNQYEVGGIDVFSPRPTIRHSIYNNPASAAVSRTASRADDRAERDISPRQILKESKTIDDLANNYDANTLRELMDRDQRRRERKRKAQEERARRRLEQYAEAGEPGPSRLQSGAPAQTGVTRIDTGFLATEAGPSKAQQRSPIERPIKETEDLSRRNPFADTESEIITPVEDPTISTAQEVRYAQMSASPPVSPVPHMRKASTYTQSTDPRSASTTNVAEPVADLDRRASETGAKRSGPLSSLFRRSRMARHPSGDSREAMPSEPSFSNTSRESMSRQLPPAHLREQAPAPRVRSGTPTRTMSKFREDLPELPRSSMPAQGADASDRTSMPVLTARQREKQPLDLPATEDLTETRAESPSVAMLSQSLASVDSEGSWLSGRPPKRTSLQSTPLATESRQVREQSSEEKIEAPSTEYFGRSEPAQAQLGASGIASALAATDAVQTASGQNEEVQRTGTVSRRPTVVNQDRTKSSEGLLREIRSAGAESEAASPVEVGAAHALAADPAPASVAPSSPGDAKTEEAESEESGGSESPSKPAVALAHTRSVSRGSAKLLDITRKGSTSTPPPSDPQ